MTIFFDGFEDGNKNEWTVGGQGGNSDYVVVTSPYEGTYAVEGQVRGGNNVTLTRSYTGISNPSKLAGALSISSSGSFDDAEIKFRDINGNGRVTIAIGSDPRAFSCSSGVCVGVNINGTSLSLKTSVGTGNYQYVEFVDFDPENGTVGEIKVNGTTEASSVSFNSFTEAFDSVQLDTFGTGDYDARYDSLELEDQSDQPGSVVQTNSSGVIQTTADGVVKTEP